MIVSTKGRYALRVMIDLAEHQNETYIPMKDVAKRQHISLKYIEKIMPVLTKNQIVEGVHGKGGGYRLCREPDKYKVSEILAVTEGTLAPVACLKPGAAPCELADRCRTLPMWKELNCVINNFFDSYTVADLTAKDKDYNNWII